MKMTEDRPYADPEKAARRILEIANGVEPIQGRIHIEKINGPFLYVDGGSPAEYGAGLRLAIERGWLKMHDSGTFVTFTRPAPSCSRDLLPVRRYRLGLRKPSQSAVGRPARV